MVEQPSAERLLARDLDEVLDVARDVFAELRGARLLVTGGTGFVGTWLLETLTWANDRLGLGMRATVLTRSPERFTNAVPHLADHAALRLLPGDVRTFDVGGERFDAAVHGATAASAALNDAAPLEMLDTIDDGTRHVLDVLAPSGSLPVLYVSSGAVYGRQPPDLSHLTEDHLGGPDPLEPASAYHEGKRAAELRCAIATAAGGPACRVARLFAFVGPYLPIDRHLAIGNFVRDALAGGPIVVAGDGTPVRSYQYASDMAAWLWTILVRGEAGRAYNVGSETAIDIGAAAAAVAAAAERPVDVVVRGVPDPARAPERYVPSTERARGELGLRNQVGLDEALRRTFAWHVARRASAIVPG